MHSSNFLILFAAAVTAQNTVQVLNLYSDDKTLVLKGSDASATTYENICKPTSAAPSGQASSSPLAESSSSPADASSVSSATPTATPSDLDLVPISPSSAEDATTPSSSTVEDLSLVPIVTTPARLRRRQSPNNDTSGCDPYTIIQGSSSWEFHLTDSQPGALTINADCSWTGDLASASLTCVATREGSAFQDPGASTSVLGPSEVASASAIVTATVVSGDGSSNATFSRTPTASRTDLATLSGTASPSASNTGMAAALALPTGAAAYVGGAAGLLMAALAL